LFAKRTFRSAYHVASALGFTQTLSDGADADESFEALLREIHKRAKASENRCLGKNPFAVGTFEGAGEKAAKDERRLEFSESLANPEATYERALEIIHADDRVACGDYF
jgi:hypothetical protein